MQKTITSLVKTDLQTSAEKPADSGEAMQPSELSLQRIRQFAAAYKSQQINDNQYLGFVMN